MFKVGDRVRVHITSVDYDVFTLDGTVKKIVGQIVFATQGVFHKNRLRRLIKKKRRRIWLNPHVDLTPRDEIIHPEVALCEDSMVGWVEFRGVKKK